MKKKKDLIGKKKWWNSNPLNIETSTILEKLTRIYIIVLA